MTLKAVPAVALAGAVTVSVDAPAGETEIAELTPVIVPVTVSVALTVRLPACVRRKALVKVCEPLSPPTNV